MYILKQSIHIIANTYIILTLKHKKEKMPVTMCHFFPRASKTSTLSNYLRVRADGPRLRIWHVRLVDQDLGSHTYTYKKC